MKHCKYSKQREVKPYKVVVTTKRYDGMSQSEFFFSTEDNALSFIDFFRKEEPKPNKFYFGTEYAVIFIGSEKFI